jgi:hypothetical protein
VYVDYGLGWKYSEKVVNLIMVSEVGLAGVLGREVHPKSANSRLPYAGEFREVLGG